MKNKLHTKNKKEWLGVISLITISIILVGVLLWKIFFQASSNMREETATHMAEIAEQVKNRSDLRTKVSWDMIQNLEEMLRITEKSSEESISGYMEYEKNVWGFKNIFLLTEDMTCYDESENLKPFTVEQKLYERMIRGEHLNTIVKNKDGEGIIYYMCAIEPVQYRDTYINGIVVSFKVKDLLKEIKEPVLENKGKCYILDYKGKSIVDINNQQIEETEDVLTRVKELIGGNDIKQFEKLKNLIYNRREGSVIFKGKNEKYYVITTPMKESERTYLCIIPESRLCDNMNKFTVKVVAYAGTIILIVCVICMIICALYSKRLKQTQEEETRGYLEQALEAANHSAKLKSRFLLSMSHDIRTPMNGIMGMSTLAKMNINNREKVEYCLNKIDVSASHLVELINDILDISRIENEKFRLNNEKFNLRKMLEEVADLTRIQTEAKEQKFNVEFKKGLDLEVWADVVGVKKILLNLLSNAVKYTPKGGKITFTAVIGNNMEDSVKVRFVVEDNGRGIEKEYLDKIYDAFTRENRDEVKMIEGSGLGLAITKHLVEAMEGAIYVDSEVGVGTRFSVTLTMKKDEPESILAYQEACEEIVDYSYQNKRLLLAEDNELNAEIMKEILGMAEAEVETAENGKKAVEMFEQSPEGYYDCILMDIQMPVMDGYTAVRNIRESKHPDAKKVIIIAMTAHAFLEDIEKARDAGMDGHVSKPIDMKNLTKKLAEIEKQRLKL
ncbi:MAG: response regulator [Lachnospiraceae bacterium]|nr:response regulator [Lachnospiraceae bacterium]